MINFFKKLIKYTVVYPLVLIFTVSLVITVYHSITVGIPIAFEQANEKPVVTTLEKEREKEAELERIAKEAEYERQRQEEAKRIAEAKYRNSPEGKTENFMGQARLDCRNTVKNTALYPSKVDFNWLSGNDYKYFMNFNSKGESRVMITLSGEMMNGFGNMIPFTAVCKYDYNPKSNTYKVVEILI